MRFYGTTMREQKIKQANLPPAAVEASKPLLAAAAAGATDSASTTAAYKASRLSLVFARLCKRRMRKCADLRLTLAAWSKQKQLPRRKALGLGPMGDSLARPDQPFKQPVIPVPTDRCRRSVRSAQHLLLAVESAWLSCKGCSSAFLTILERCASVC